jgi:hypothetical protein
MSKINLGESKIKYNAASPANPSSGLSQNDLDKKKEVACKGVGSPYDNADSKISLPATSSSGLSQEFVDEGQGPKSLALDPSLSSSSSSLTPPRNDLYEKKEVAWLGKVAPSAITGPCEGVQVSAPPEKKEKYTAM